ncbi:MAG: PstS family phosphate ABC transporter substrate-binding protein [Planctomycetota bacterium]|nr:PstS family phosphate ABC transporter substrate-binding protein [Planctomycetota bacterium]
MHEALAGGARSVGGYQARVAGAFLVLAALVAGLVLTARTSIAASSGDPPAVSNAELPPYTPVPGVSGSVKSIGSNTLNNVMTHWAESFRRFYPSVTIEVEDKGSKGAPPALMEGQAQFGPMSREMTPKEVDDFERRLGYKPTSLRVGIDCLAIFVHRSLPLEEISLEQVQRIFSVSGPNLTWDQLGVKDPAFQRKPVALYGRTSSSGTYDFFKEHALGGKDFKKTVKEQPGSGGVINAVAADPFGIGYCGIGYKTADVKALKVSMDAGPAVEPNEANALSGDYPLARFLFVYANIDPQRQLDPLRAEFIRFIYSRDGQESLTKDGYIRIPPAIAAEELSKLGLD